MRPQPDTDRDGQERGAALAPRRASWPRASLKGAAAAALIGALSLLAQESSRSSRSSQPPAAGEAAAPFVPAFAPSAPLVARPAVDGSSRYRLDDPSATDPPRSEPARLSPATGLREEALAQGAFEVFEAPFLRLTVTEGAAPTGPSLFVALARRAADGQGLSIARTGERGRLDTKFGPVETLEATLTQDGSRVCAGFATLAQRPIRVDGWLCAPLGQPPEPRAIVCALDKLVLNGQASVEVEAEFRAAESRRDAACGARPSAREAMETGSINPRATRKIEAKMRRSAQARP